MKVLVVNNMAPFVRGGAEELADHLASNLEVAGHRAEVLRIPFQWEPPERIPTQMLLARTLSVQNVDRVIALKFPAYLAEHDSKVLWLLHQFRQAYDLHDAGQSGFEPTPEHDAIRDLIHNADNATFDAARAIFVNSSVTQNRLKSYNGFDSEVLLPPVNDPEMFGGGPTGEYIFVGGRINEHKRQHLFIEALAHADPRCRLIVAGPPDAPHDADRLRKTVERLDLAERVTLDLRRLPRSEYAEYVNNSAAVGYAPFDEDSLGYVTMEGATARKALLTTSDSGGITQLVRTGDTGWVTDPTAEALGEALTDATRNSNQTAELGLGAHERLASLGITWPDTIEKLLR